MTSTLRDQELCVQMAAAKALGELGPIGVYAVPALVDLMGHQNGHVRVPAAMAV